MLDTDRAALAWRLAAELARARHENQAGAALARAAAALAGAESVRLWMIDHTHGYRLAGVWPEGSAEPGQPPDEVARAVVLETPSVTPAEGHFRTRLAVPVLSGDRPMGAIELLERGRATGPFTTADTSQLAGLLEVADSALQAVRATAAREHGHIEAITSLTRLFDISRSLGSTLEMKDLKPRIVGHVQAALEPEATYLWLLDEAGERLTLAAAAGRSSEAAEGWELGMGEGAAGQVAASGEALLIDDPAEVPGLEERPDIQAGLEITSLAAAPILSGAGEKKLLGVIELVNKEEEGRVLEGGDLMFLNEAATTAGLALDNARRLDAEQRASDLGSLLATAQELTSSLDVQKVAFTLVHKAATVIRYRRAEVGLFKGAGLELTAVSGQTFVDEKLPEMKALRDLLTWAAGLDEGLYIVQEEDGTIDTDRTETREKFRAYFEVSGSRSFVAVPMSDDEGRLGIFAFEGAEPYAFSERDIEAAGLLGTQATVAIRNATLYQQIPMARVFRPFARRKQKLLGESRVKALALLGGAALLVAALVFVPVPLRVSGRARLLPDVRLPVTSEVDGRLARVFIREGDRVEAGQVLAALDDSDYRTRAVEARARYGMTLREGSRLRAQGQAAGARIEAARLEGLRAELALAERRLAGTEIRAVATGIVATPRVEEMAGARIARGDVFCELVEPGRASVEVVVPERDAGLIGVGMPVKVKLNAFPTRSFSAKVERVGVAATDVEGEAVFLVRARLEDAPAALRTGMTGQAKISTGPASAGRVLFRAPARWIWNSVWGWLP